jgi:hypothetical protein
MKTYLPTIQSIKNFLSVKIAGSFANRKESEAFVSILMQIKIRIRTRIRIQIRIRLLFNKKHNLQRITDKTLGRVKTDVSAVVSKYCSSNPYWNPKESKCVAESKS